MSVPGEIITILFRRRGIGDGRAEQGIINKRLPNGRVEVMIPATGETFVAEATKVYEVQA